MADALKNNYGPEVPRWIAEAIRAVYVEFHSEAFVSEILETYSDLELMDRGRRIALVLRKHLPDDYPAALEILLASVRVEIKRPEHAMASFYFLPHLHFVATYGLEDFERSMDALYQLTSYFTAEFAIRPFLLRYPAATMERLRLWATDSSVDVRRLVSEGSRPRLPWAPRLRAFQKDPAPVLDLLERLKDDPELYVRRSVANHLNDIGKDHPEVLVATVRRWMADAPEGRRWTVRHALRSLVKSGHPGALAVLGYGAEPEVMLEDDAVVPQRVRVGGSVELSAGLRSRASTTQRLLIDFCVHFVKANGSSAAKVFKLKVLELEPGDVVTIRKTISLKPLTTRKLYPGAHRIDLLINGKVFRVGAFELVGQTGVSRLGD